MRWFLLLFYSHSRSVLRIHMLQSRTIKILNIKGFSCSQLNGWIFTWTVCVLTTERAETQVKIRAGCRKHIQASMHMIALGGGKPQSLNFRQNGEVRGQKNLSSTGVATTATFTRTWMIVIIVVTLMILRKAIPIENKLIRKVSGIRLGGTIDG